MKQAVIRKYEVEAINLVAGKFLANTEKTENISIAESGFLELYYRLGGRVDVVEYVGKEKEMLVDLISVEMNNPNEEMIEKFAMQIQNGIYVNGKKYVRSLKSASMFRQQRTYYVEEKLAEKIEEYATLGRVPELTVVSKYETAKSLPLSSARQIKGLPRMIVVPDCVLEVCDTFQTVEQLENMEEVSENVQKWIEHDENFRNMKRSADDFLTQEKLKKLPEREKTHFTMIGWKKKNRMVEKKHILTPVSSQEYEGKFYACYEENQTVAVNDFELTSENLGFRLSPVRTENVKLNVFDGQGLGSLKFFEKIQTEMEMKYLPSALQIRLPFVKGLVAQIDFHKWFAENGVTEIADIWGKKWKVSEVDVILSESMFKAKHEKKEGKSGWLFSSMEDYLSQLEKYGWDSFGVANVSKNPKKMRRYTPLSYQAIHALNMTPTRIKEISGKTGHTMHQILKEKDVMMTKAFLDLVTDDEDSHENMTSFAAKAIDLHSVMIHDQKISRFVLREIENRMKDFCRGRIPVVGEYYYAVSDPIAQMEHIAGMNVKGFLEKGQYFISGNAGQRAIFRNPITSHREVIKGQFVKSQNPFLQHFQTCAIFNVHDLSAPKLGGMDFDGDIVMVAEEQIVIDAVMEGITIINEEDKATAKPMEISIQNIISLEKTQAKNGNLTGIVTNLNTYFQNRAIEETGSVWAKDLEISICKALQGIILDSAKTNLDVSNCIPKLMEIQGKGVKPYFMYHVYGGSRSKYMGNTSAPFNSFVQKTEEYLEKMIKKTQDGYDYLQETLRSVNTKDFTQDRTKYSEMQLIEIINSLESAYEWYNKEKRKINLSMKEFNNLPKFRKDKNVKEMLNQKFKQLCVSAYEKMYETCPNDSILASALIQMSEKKGNNSAPWDICPHGIIENLTTNQENVKKDVFRVQEIDQAGREFHGRFRVSGGIATIQDMKWETELCDGVYPVRCIVGKHYAEIERTRNVEKKKESDMEHDGRTSRKPLFRTEIGGITPVSTEEMDVNSFAGQKFVIVETTHNDLKYVTFVDENGEKPFWIGQKDVINLKEGYSLRDYLGCVFVLDEIVKINRKSFKAKFSTVE